MTDYQKLFSELNTKLKERKMKLDLVCVGGYVLQYFNIRSTIDVDAFFNAPADLLVTIEKIGYENSANRDGNIWLNNNVSFYNKRPPLKICETVLELSNLKVRIVPLEYVAGMKGEAMRDRDIDDIGSIIKFKNYKDPIEFKKNVDKYGFDLDESVLYEGFSIAYGLDWLKDYLMNCLKE